MINISEKDLTNRYKDLSPRLKNAIDSSSTFNLIKNISRAHSLSDEDIEILAVYAAYVLLGVLEPKDFFNEVKIYLPADEKTTVEIVREINFQVFFPLHNELEALYKLEGHIEEELEKEAKVPIVEIKPKEEIKKESVGATISLEKIGREQPAAVTKLEVKGEPFDVAQGKPSGVAEGQPLIIHREEAAPAAAAEEKRPFRGLEFPFGFFGKEKTAATPEPVKVKIEGLGERAAKPTIKKEEKRVVHYSELRTPLTPFQKPEEEIINLETLTKKKPPPKMPPQTEIPKAEQKPEPKSEAKPEFKGPSIEGNIIDLKNL